jgi:hypothetical protein
MSEARDSLVAGLRQTAAYVQSLALTESQVLTSGFDIVVWNRSTVILTAPVISGLDNSVSEQLSVGIKAVNGAKAYQVQYCTGTAAWTDLGIWSNTKGVVILNLTPGTVYSVRVRAIGGAMKYGPWSISSSMMSM